MTLPDVETLLSTMAKELRGLLSQRGIDRPIMIGIHTGGVWIAQRLHQLLDLTEPLGDLDISFYRDDFSRIGMNPQVQPSHLPMNIDNRDIILVDDVLYTGRTIRAALNEIFDYGRPASVILVTLVDRGGRELPIQADITGTTMRLAPRQHIKLSGPKALQLSVLETEH